MPHLKSCVHLRRYKKEDPVKYLMFYFWLILFYKAIL